MDAPCHAEALLARFGSIAGVAGARTRDLADVLGAGSPVPSHIGAVRRLLHAGMREAVVRKPLDPADPVVLDYLIAHFTGMRHEEMLVLFGDSTGCFLDSETLVSGQSWEVAFAPVAVFRRAIELGATQLVLAHNHPSGVAAPSPFDIASTRRLVRDGGHLGIGLRDHLIVAGRAVFSMRQAGLL